MKPKDLKHPFSWDDRCVLIQDRVWHVPDYCPDYASFTFPGWSDPLVFGNDKPVIVEYCCGNGTWLAAKAQKEPQYNWVGVEWRFERVRKVWSKIQNLKLDNLLVISGEACLTTKFYFPSNSLHAVYINFPDPFPKTRHAKYRLFQQPFIQELARVLQMNGSATIATDDPDYSEQLVTEFLGCDRFQCGFPAPHFVTEWLDYGASFFDSLWRAKGRVIRYHRFDKRS